MPPAKREMMTIDACCTIGKEGDSLPSLDYLLREMDRSGVDRAVVHPPDRCFAFDNDEGNDLTTAAAREHQDRFMAAVTASPWRRDAWDSLKRAFDQGGRILCFSPSVQGFNPGTRILDPILERLEDTGLSLPVYFHTGHYSFGAPSQLFLLAGRFARINFIMGHTGATDFASDVVPVCRQRSNIYVESSFARPPGFAGRLKDLGWDKGIMGSGFPLNDLEFEWSEMRRILPPEHHAAVLGGNLASLVGGLE